MPHKNIIDINSISIIGYFFYKKNIISYVVLSTCTKTKYPIIPF